MPAMKQSQLLVAALKRHLKAREITYPGLARGLGLSLPTIKRMFSGRALTLQRLDAVCEFLGIDLADLTAQARTSDSLPHRLDRAQEKALAEDPQLLALLQYLLNEWTVEHILERLEIAPAECVQRLARLDRLGIIELHPGNRVRLLVARTIDWQPDGPVRERYGGDVIRELMLNPFSGEGEAIRYAFREVSAASHHLMLRRLQRLADDFEELADMDSTLPLSGRHAIGFVIALRPWQFSLMDAIPPKARGAATRPGTPTPVAIAAGGATGMSTGAPPKGPRRAAAGRRS